MRKKGIELVAGERVQDAIETYQKAIECCPPDSKEHLSVLHNNLGIAYNKLGRELEAKGHFSTAIELNDKYAKPLWHRMGILKKEEDYDGALMDAKKIGEVDP